jgi:mono/diheme cytochrome c family protein
MARTSPITAVEVALARRRRLRLPLALALLIALLVGLVAVVTAAWNGPRFLRADRVPAFAGELDHFKYGSIGAERDSGIPYLAWQALPRLFPEVFGDAAAQEAARARGEGPYTVFGFLYEPARTGHAEPRDLPIGIARRDVRGVEMVWFNCAVCHTGTVRETEGGPRRLVAGMAANNLDLHRFVAFVADIADDPRIAAGSLIAAIEAGGTRLGLVDRLLWRFVVAPGLREGLLERRAQLAPLLAMQPAWGPGRVDTFNPYKVVQLRQRAGTGEPSQWIGASDFPTIFYQRERAGMQLHWDGNNPSLAERNLSAAIGAGLVLDRATAADHASIRRVATWLLDLPAPPSPLRVDANAALLAEGQRLYMRDCAACHGFQEGARYRFEGAQLGRVTPIAAVGTDRARLDSYTPDFVATQHRVLGLTAFVKTDGYANHPLDGLWLRGPYLHNGAVPTLEALLMPPAERPRFFLRGDDTLDRARGGFSSETFETEGACLAAARRGPRLFCFDTHQPGNGNGGHEYGTQLGQSERAALLAYLRTF